MNTPNYLLPSEFNARVMAAAETRDANAVVYAINEGWSYRHPDMVAANAQSYTVPLPAALALYRMDPQRQQALLPCALGFVGSPAYWHRLRLAAREAYDCQDWSSLGRLAYFAEMAAACPTTEDPAVPASRNVENESREDAAPAMGAKELCTALRLIFDLKAGALPVESYLTGAMAYLCEIPAGFAISPAIFGWSDPSAGSDAAQSWRLLRIFATQNRAVWRRYPQAIEAVAQFRNPLVQLLAAEFNAVKDAIEQLPVSARLANPFAAQPAQVVEAAPAADAAPEAAPSADPAPAAAAGPTESPAGQPQRYDPFDELVFEPDAWVSADASQRGKKLGFRHFLQTKLKQLRRWWRRQPTERPMVATAVVDARPEPPPVIRRPLP